MCRNCVIKGLEGFMNLATENMKEHGFINIPLPDIEFCSDNACYDQHRRSNGRMLQFPGRNYNQAQQCVVMLRVIYLVLENLRSNTNITTRDIYYQDVALFRNQQQVSTAIERLCVNTGVARSLLGIVPSPKGLVVGDLQVTLSEYDPDSKQTITVRKTINRFNGPSLIPVGNEIIHIKHLELNVPKYILIVEKEGVFSHIYSQLTEAILITGKGFPDHYTRKFLYAIHKSYPDLPIFGLVDSDVHGIHILRTYENSGAKTLEFHFPIETVEFLGVSIFDYQDGWVDINTREYKLIMSMLQKDWIKDEKHAAWRREVQRQMFMGKKVEMNILDRSHLTTLVKYVRDRVDIMRSELEQRQQRLMQVMKAQVIASSHMNSQCDLISVNDLLIDPGDVLKGASPKSGKGFSTLISERVCAESSGGKTQEKRTKISNSGNCLIKAEERHGKVISSDDAQKKTTFSPRRKQQARSTPRPSSYELVPGVY